MAHCYIVTAQPATAIVGALVCSFTGENTRDLILTKGNHLEVHRFSNTGLVPILDASIYGKIVSIDKYRVMDSKQDLLFVLTERKNFCILQYDSVSKKLVTRTTVNVKDRVGREIENGICGMADVSNSIIGMLIYEGVLKIFPIDPQSGAVRDPFNVRMEEIRHSDFKFIHGYPRPTFALLYEDNKQKKHIKTYSVDMREKELVAGPWKHSLVDRTANFMIPVPAGIGGGVILVGTTMITYYSNACNTSSNSSTTPPISVIITPTRMMTYEMVDTDGSRYLLGDIHGRLYVLVLKKQPQSSPAKAMNCTSSSSSSSMPPANTVIVGLAVDYLGTTSIASQISYLDSGVVFVSSRFGDSQLVKLKTQRGEDGSYVNV